MGDTQKTKNTYTVLNEEFQCQRGKKKLHILLLLTLVNILESVATFKRTVPSYKVLLLRLSLLQRSRVWSLEYSPLWGPTSPTSPRDPVSPPPGRSLQCQHLTMAWPSCSKRCTWLSGPTLPRSPLPLLQPLTSKAVVSLWQCVYARTQYLPLLEQLEGDRVFVSCTRTRTLPALAQYDICSASRAPGT